MSELKPEVPTKSLSTTLITGVSHCSIFDEENTLPTCSSMSYTIGAVVEAADNQPQGAPSQPLKPGAVKAMNTVLRARVPESAILRDKSGEL
jgi:hypothetical protein